VSGGSFWSGTAIVAFLIAVGYSASNTSPTLRRFLSRLDELVKPNQKR
jgi:hypothetical protein